MNESRKQVAPAAKKRGADAHVPSKSPDHRPTEEDRRLEQGLEESMAGSDPPSITQPAGDQKNSPSGENPPHPDKPSFEKPLGSSAEDQADLREVAKEAKRK
jgi:hypothetical protein